jgi:hypothetical protein
MKGYCPMQLKLLLRIKEAWAKQKKMNEHRNTTINKIDSSHDGAKLIILHWG